MARDTLPKMSYWLLASANPGSSWGWVVMTWKDSMNASWATFQFTLSTLEMCARVYLSSSGQRSKNVGSSPRKSASGSQSGSMLMKTKPPQVPTRTSGRRNLPGRTCGKSQALGTRLRLPFSDQQKPWKAHSSSSTWPRWSRSTRPRCRHAL